MGNKTVRKNSKKKRTVKKKEKQVMILGYGKDGCVILDEHDPTKIFKLVREGINIDWELQETLKKIDTDENRFSTYSHSNVGKEKLKKQIKQCSALLSSPIGEMISMTKLEPLDTEKMTRTQYRHLRKSIEILHEHGISHGDLIDNVMMSEEDQLPRIIDWENAKLAATELDKTIDQNAFFHSGRFKIA